MEISAVSLPASKALKYTRSSAARRSSRTARRLFKEIFSALSRLINIIAHSPVGRRQIQKLRQGQLRPNPKRLEKFDQAGLLIHRRPRKGLRLEQPFRQSEQYRFPPSTGSLQIQAARKFDKLSYSTLHTSCHGNTHLAGISSSASAARRPHRNTGYRLGVDTTCRGIRS